MSHDAYISYSHVDKTIADAVCGRLEGSGVRCWIAPRDVRAGLPYAECIVDALNGSAVVILVFSSAANISPQVSREVERAVAKDIPLLPFRLEEVPLSKSMEYYISSCHWLDAMTPPVEERIADLTESVLFLLKRPVSTEAHVSSVRSRQPSRSDSPTSPSDILRKRTAIQPCRVAAGATPLQDRYPFLMNFERGDPQDYVITWGPPHERDADGDHIVHCRKCGAPEYWTSNPIMECNTNCPCGWGPRQKGTVYLSFGENAKAIGEVFAEELQSSRGFTMECNALTTKRRAATDSPEFVSELRNKGVFAYIAARDTAGDEGLAKELRLAREAELTVLSLAVDDATDTGQAGGYHERVITFPDSGEAWNLRLKSALRDALYELPINRRS